MKYHSRSLTLLISKRKASVYSIIPCLMYQKTQAIITVTITNSKLRDILFKNEEEVNYILIARYIQFSFFLLQNTIIYITITITKRCQSNFQPTQYLCYWTTFMVIVIVIVIVIVGLNVSGRSLFSDSDSVCFKSKGETYLTFPLHTRRPRLRVQWSYKKKFSLI